MLTLRRTKSALALRAFAGCAVAMPMTPSVAAMQASGDKVQQVAAMSQLRLTDIRAILITVTLIRTHIHIPIPTGRL